MSRRPMSADELQQFHAWLPLGLTEDQITKVLRAAEAACAVAFNGGIQAHAQINHIYRDAAKEIPS